jgi:hypothetical protein
VGDVIVRRLVRLADEMGYDHCDLVTIMSDR